MTSPARTTSTHHIGLSLVCTALVAAAPIATLLGLRYTSRRMDRNLDQVKAHMRQVYWKGYADAALDMSAAYSGNVVPMPRRSTGRS